MPGWGWHLETSLPSADKLLAQTIWYSLYRGRCLWVVHHKTGSLVIPHYSEPTYLSRQILITILTENCIKLLQILMMTDEPGSSCHHDTWDKLGGPSKTDPCHGVMWSLVTTGYGIRNMATQSYDSSLTSETWSGSLSRHQNSTNKFVLMSNIEWLVGCAKFFASRMISLDFEYWKC